MVSHRERLLRVMDGGVADRVPWVPRLLLWYEAARRRGTMPERFEGLSLREVERKVGVGTPARDGAVLSERMTGVEVTQDTVGGESVTRYRTPVGTVETRERGSEVLDNAGITGRETESLVTSPEDYRVVQYMVEHTEVEPTYDAYLSYEEEIGEEGVPMVKLGDCPMGTVLKVYIGWGRAYLELADNPDAVERLWGAARELMRKKVRLAAASPARLFLLGEHFHSQMTPPTLFTKYFLADCQDTLIHIHGVLRTEHGCRPSSPTRIELAKRHSLTDYFLHSPVFALKPQRGGKVFDVHSLIFSRSNFLFLGRHLFSRATVEDGHFFGSQPEGGA